MGGEHQTFGTWVVAVPNRASPAHFRGDLAYRVSPYARTVLIAVPMWQRQSDVFRPEKVVSIVSRLRVHDEQEGGMRLEQDEAAADAEGDGFGAGGGAEFAEDGGDVKFGGVVGNVEAGGDFLVG
jgi:hypothetical protein